MNERMVEAGLMAFRKKNDESFARLVTAFGDFAEFLMLAGRRVGGNQWREFPVDELRLRFDRLAVVWNNAGSSIPPAARNACRPLLKSIETSLRDEERGEALSIGILVLDDFRRAAALLRFYAREAGLPIQAGPCPARCCGIVGGPWGPEGGA